MDRNIASDLLAFLAVARERSFTRAAAKLGISQPTLSQIVHDLEERLGVRLLNRTTRSVTPTQAGERLFVKIGPKFDEMDVELAALGELRENPAGTIRITATEFAADAILMPVLAKILPQYPDIKVEVFIDYGLTNIVAAQYDAGIRPGELVAKDMIAVRVGPDLRMAVVGAPSYFSSRKRPRTPQDLTHHNCINLHRQPVWQVLSNAENSGRGLPEWLHGLFYSPLRLFILSAYACRTDGYARRSKNGRGVWAGSSRPRAPIGKLRLDRIPYRRSRRVQSVEYQRQHHQPRNGGHGLSPQRQPAELARRHTVGL